MTALRFELLATDGNARTGILHTPRGDIRTPAFMPVGTAGSVKAMLPQSVRETGADIILGNTYHLMLRPGAERVARLGGLHKFAGWERPILTDSGGYQVMSLSKLRKVIAEARGDVPFAYRRRQNRIVAGTLDSRCSFCSAQTSPCSSTNA